ncbi:MAG: 3D-(3,5/4)-trihydroxycyclohexane-1,2-dione acylhydrolase (decyclizing) [Clostridium sp.]|uniref:3D-(3,5/4)-trihydroxycyclohexane-1,2-dione acylhydrolase (decyclizing) n=1 Tax=Clostridium sp. TaxID=1506 RepID=UPI0025C0288E|nr:3D-(3,5/4)-trihydroxycyclohexane-1,2-dione acylhydrolase (decyclizing) [Clostridium sp.]MCH3964816.1 3D-(3,5/4)-trihydroxycyclohexane-1,2-dione acylhydrolase (decyclizing) [Clostridium sp.]MCI1715287.1 3D-(3,5/4)-trihydroxycyclohexane-1,2-dione acylhydrolase (decyclizing) [Clostridium sp.]MCI1799549.1 3D-(3,5/4)-trihydroxycyclohexane-1,2-dione acylhydrolase (decyclizing) [Clostridium sp.]MCI1813470.1 3D-(3,5/4)-trihydroxycyclohexane-1,2-dione acylhydrolase (decyclizing) [Clostridium sp.]MCI
MSRIKMTVGQAIVKFLNNQYVEFDGIENQFVDGFFTIFGHGMVVGLGQALAEDPGHLKVYQGRNEQGMAHAAMSYAKQNNRRRIIACTSSIGPGAANMITAALTASINNVPLLLFPSDSFATRQPDPVLQQIEQPYDLSITTNDCYKPVVRYWDRISRPEHLMTALINAMRVLTDVSSTGAVCIALPQDVQGESFEFPDYFFKKRIHHIARRLADSKEIENAVELISKSRYPLFIGGGGVRYSEAGEALQEVCRKFKIPYAETQAGKSATPSSNSLNLGGVGITGTLAANTIAEKADLVVGIGTRFNDFVTCSKEVFRNPDVRFVTINTSEFDAGKMDASRVVGDAKLNLQAICEKLEQINYKPSYGKDEIAQIKKEWEEERKSVCNAIYTGKDFVPCVPSWTPEIINDYIRDIGGTITESNGVGIVREVIDDDAIVVAAAGSLPADLERLWVTDVKDSYNMEYGASCMGYEIAGALGSKLAEPSREVYALVGDGSFLMLNSEITTAVQENAKITIVVFDNAAFGCINNLQMGSGIDSLCTEFRYRDEKSGKTDGKYIYVDFAKVGEGYGMKGYTAKTPQELRAALEDARKQTKPCIIDAKVLPKTMAEGYKSWWHIGVASVSKSEKTREAYKNLCEKLKKARMY